MTELAIASALALGCGRGATSAVPDAAVTGEHVSIEPISSDATTTSAVLAIDETVKSPRPEVDVGGDASADAGLPRWVPKNATFSVVDSSDRDRNLGIVAPSPLRPQRVTVDAGGVAVEIEVRPQR